MSKFNHKFMALAMRFDARSRDSAASMSLASVTRPSIDERDGS